MRERKFPQTDDLAHRNPDGTIWVNPIIPKTTRSGIHLQVRVRNYEVEYFKQRKNHGDLVARKRAIAKQYRGLNRQQILESGAILDAVSDRTHQQKGEFQHRKKGTSQLKRLFGDFIP